MSYSPEEVESLASEVISGDLSRTKRDRCADMLDAYAATLRQQAAQPDDSRCPPTYRREEAVKVLIGMGWSWDGKQWNAPVQQAARVDGEYASDLRHLIYLDTQFGWRGETDLKLHEMQALEARGWIAEGEENSEYAITEEGERLINAALSAQPTAHPDDAAVDAFAEAMRAKLAEARAKGRGGWQDKTDCPQQRLSDMLRAHVEKGDPRDVANFCMFLHQRGEAIMPAQPAPRCDKPGCNCAAWKLEGCAWDDAQPAEPAAQAEADELIDAYDHAVRNERDSGFLPLLAQQSASACVAHNRNRLRNAIAAQPRASEPAERQGEVVGEVFGPKAVSTMVALDKPLPPGTKLYTNPAAPVGVPDVVTAEILGGWCNLLTHAWMYVQEGGMHNAWIGIEQVEKEMRDWQRKLATAPSAPQGEG